MKHIFKKVFFLLFSASVLSASQAVKVTIPSIPKVPEVPKVTAVVPDSVYIIKDGDYKTNDEIIKEATAPKVVKFSNHVAPVYEEKKDDPNKVIEVGDISNGHVTAYLQAPLLTSSQVKETLKEAGFTILDTYRVDKKGLATSIVFTNKKLIKLASKKGRGFASTLRVTVDKKNSLISITNPIYLLAGFMQKEYEQKLAEETLISLRSAFKNLTNSTETLKFRTLAHYKFMEGMPKYEDMQTIKKAPSAKLLANAKKSKKVLFELKLLNGATLIGVKLSKRTSKFIKKTGYKNAGLLPYPVLIENGEAKILDPKFYIALMYPKLKMSQFMKIATVPGAISKDIDKIFR